MKISKMITTLQAIKEGFGDTEVLLSNDSEGNSFCTISKKSFSLEDVLVIYPINKRIASKKGGLYD